MCHCQCTRRPQHWWSYLQSCCGDPKWHCRYIKAFDLWVKVLSLQLSLLTKCDSLPIITIDMQHTLLPTYTCLHIHWTMHSGIWHCWLWDDGLWYDGFWCWLRLHECYYNPCHVYHGAADTMLQSDNHCWYWSRDNWTLLC